MREDPTGESHPLSKELLVVAAAITITGILFRLQGQTSTMWLDEAAWADQTLRGEAWLDPKRPTGFIALIWLLGKVYASEWVLRIPSLLASVGLIIAAGVLVHRMARSRLTTYLAMLLVALQPVFIAHAKEAKPYMLEAALHVLLIVAALAYHERQTRARLVALLAAIAVLPWFATTLVFLLPSAVLAALLVAWRERKRAQLVVILGVSATLAGALLVLYLGYLGSEEIRGAESYWGNKYGVFYTGAVTAEMGQAAWILQEHEGIAAWAWVAPGHTWCRALSLLVLSANALGLLVLGLRKNWPALLCLALPLPIMAVFNAMGLWPSGPFRTNVFAISYVILPALVAIDVPVSVIAGRLRVFDGHAGVAARLAGALVLCAVAVWHAPPNVGYYAKKVQPRTPSVGTMDGNAREAIEYIARNTPSEGTGERAPLVCDFWFGPAAEFYLRHHPRVRHLGQRFARDFLFRCSTGYEQNVYPLLRDALDRHGSAWLVVSKAGGIPGSIWRWIDREVMGRRLRLEFNRALPGGGRMALVHRLARSRR